MMDAALVSGRNAERRVGLKALGHVGHRRHQDPAGVAHDGRQRSQACFSLRAQCRAAAGTSRAGLERKKLSGLRWNPARSTGITGQSSLRGKWFVPNTYQTTTLAEPTISGETDDKVLSEMVRNVAHILFVENKPDTP